MTIFQWRAVAAGMQRWFGVALLGLLAACGSQELYGKLTEQQANEMVALLRGAGLSASKMPSKEMGQFSVGTSSNDFGPAVQLLKAQGYPKESHETLGQVFKKEGFVSSPLEERARLTHALSQEVSTTIANIDGVLVARVHVVVPEKNPLADAPKPASASVFIKHRAGLDLTPRLGQIKALVVNAIEGLPYDHVTVAFFPSDPWPNVPVQSQSTVDVSAQRLEQVIGAVSALGVLLMLGGLGTWAWSRGKRAKSWAQAPRQDRVVTHTPTARAAPVPEPAGSGRGAS